MKTMIPPARTACAKTVAARLRTACALFPVLLLLALPAVSQAQLTYTTNNGAITIAGYTGPGGAVAIPSAINGLPVTSIGSYAFDRSDLTSVTIPGSVTSIGSYAFDQSGLTSVTIPDSVTSVESYAFFECPGLASVTIGNGVTNIGAAAFAFSPGLATVTIGNGVTTIGAYAFFACSLASGVTIPDSVTSIGAYAFSACGLSSVTIPNSVTSIGDFVFAGCVGLGSVYFQGDAPTVSGSAFLSDTNAAVHYLPGTTGWGSTFDGLPTVLWDVATAMPTVVNGFVVGTTVTDGGLGYTNTPTVRIIDGGGTGAQAVAVVNNGRVTAVNILNTGFGYANTPTVVIAPPFIPQPTMGIAAMSLLSFTNLSLGASYQLQFSSGSTWTSTGAAFTAASSAFTQDIPGIASTNTYRLTSTPVPGQAYATAQVINGFVVGATVTSGGSGYTTNPAVTILSQGAGSDATAIATLSGGAVTGITIASTGFGYTTASAIRIAPPPPANALWPNVTQAMRLALASLSPYDSYQLEFAPIPGVVWTNFARPFIPTSTVSTQDVVVTGNAGLFRVRSLPQ